ncbi:MAG: hypothetical protein Q8M95_04945 [Candidatus Methanoperedens sp.]|nr:hypothetical protein [Candidatus Methanoperedens sp.]
MNYFKGGTVKRSFGIHPAEFAKMGLVSLSSMLFPVQVIFQPGKKTTAYHYDF